MERSPEMMLALLGILKAGGAYVPLDPAYPKDQQTQITRRSLRRPPRNDTLGGGKCKMENSNSKRRKIR
jgi:acyl-CoA synthetase (AMP-forming)/AMP-acid ligase II